MKRSVVMIVIIVSVAAVAWAVVYLWVLPTTVAVAEVEEQSIVHTLLATGQVEPSSRVVIAAQVSSRVDETLIEAGDRVDAQQVLMQLDDTQARLELASAEAEVAQARAQMSAVVDQGAPTALEDLNKATMALEAAEEEYERAQRLFDAGLITGAEVDARRRQVAQAQSDVERTRAVYREVGLEGSRHEEAAAVMEGALAQRSLARLRLRRHQIRAPIDARVLTVEADKGMGVQPGSTVAVVAPVEPVDIRITPDERELESLEVGQLAWVVSDAYEDRPFEAVVRRIDPTVDVERGTLTAYLGVDEPPSFLRVGMTATAEVEMARLERAMAVPRVAVRDVSRHRAWVLVIDEGRARRQEVIVGIGDDRLWQIRAGLEIGDIVVVDADTEPGDRVRRGEIEELEPVDETPSSPDLPVPGRVDLGGGDREAN